MPLDKLVLILISMIAATVQMPAIGWIVFLPVVLIGYVLWRVIADRLNNREDDHYDHIEK